MIVMKFKRGGKVEMNPTGYPGGECRRVTDRYRQRMVGIVTKDKDTPEAAMPERVENVVTNQQAEQA
jgi:hypothetical protein